MDHEGSRKQNCHDELGPDEDQKWLLVILNLSHLLTKIPKDYLKKRRPK
jgi:hypothetical protein